MALEDMYSDSGRLAMENRAQLPPIAGTPDIYSKAGSQLSSLGIDPSAWSTFWGLWVLLLALFVFLVVRTRSVLWVWSKVARWILFIWVALCLFGALTSTRRGSPAYSFWIAISAWPPMVLLACVAVFLKIKRRP